jgi:anti-sigma regulatory factor (Ser/Thr protein kinase)
MTQPPSLTLLDPAHLATICHELRQPLHAYRIFSDRLTPQLTEQQLALATQMNTAIQSLTEMAESLHEMARALDAEAHQQPCTVELQHLLADLREHFASPRLRVKQTKLRTETNAIRLATILKHLVRNALRHSSGRCLIGCRQQAGEIRLDVIDQGPGLPEKITTTPRPQRSKATVTQTHPGLGLGLHIVQQLAARLGLRLVIVSRPGHGTRASLFLPDATVSSKASIQNKNPQQWLTGKTIQLVGINPPGLNELHSLLSTWGAQITVDTNQAGAPAPDLIIANTHHSATRSRKPHCPMLILAAPPSLSPTAGTRYLPPPTTPPRLRMAISNILGGNS